FSSRRRHTISKRDWSSDVCSSDLCYEDEDAKERRAREKLVKSYKDGRAYKLLDRVWRKSYYKNLPKAIEEYECKNGFEQGLIERSEERRVGKEGRTGKEA